MAYIGMAYVVMTNIVMAHFQARINGLEGAKKQITQVMQLWHMHIGHNHTGHNYT